MFWAPPIPKINQTETIMKLTKITAASLVALALATSAQAAMITGSIDIGAASTVSIDFANNTVAFTPAAPGVNAVVTYSDGILGTLVPANFLPTLQYQDFTYSPLIVSNPIWTDGFTSFHLGSIFEIDEDSSGDTQALKLFGTGVLTNANYDNTPGLWSFTADSTTGGARFSWSSTSSAKVPDGGTTFALLGASLLGLGGVRRFFALRK
jgi:hypothetical protein